MNRWMRATINSINGIRFALRNEAAFRAEAASFVLALILALVIAESAGWYVAMVGSVILVMLTELLNTAIERLCDHVAPEIHPRIGAVKDAGSAAVFCALVLAGLVWIAAIGVRLGLL